MSYPEWPVGTPLWMYALLNLIISFGGGFAAFIVLDSLHVPHARLFTIGGAGFMFLFNTYVDWRVQGRRRLEELEKES